MQASQLPGAYSNAAHEPSKHTSAVQKFMEETDWHALAGKRVKSIRQNLMAECVRFDLLLESLVLEAVESISEWYFVAERRCRATSVPPLLDLLCLERSPATLALQFLAALAHQYTQSAKHCRSVHMLILLSSCSPAMYTKPKRCELGC